MLKKNVDIVEFAINNAAAGTFVTPDQARQVVLLFLQDLKKYGPDKKMAQDVERGHAVVYQQTQKYYAGPEKLIDHLLERAVNLEVSVKKKIIMQSFASVDGTMTLNAKYPRQFTMHYQRKLKDWFDNEGGEQKSLCLEFPDWLDVEICEGDPPKFKWGMYQVAIKLDKG